MGKSQTKNKLHTKKKQIHERDPDPWFNSYRYPASAQAWHIVSTVVDGLEQQQKRQRARNTKDKNWFREVVPALVADLVHHHLDGSHGTGLVVPRAKSALGKPSRYHGAIFTRTFPKLLDDLEGRDYLQQKIGEYSGWQGRSTRTTIRAGGRLIELIKKHGLTFTDIRTATADEVIILKRAKQGYWDEGGPIEYEDTARFKV